REEVKSLNAFEVADARQALKLLGADYVSRYPKSDKVTEVKFNIARAHYDDGEFEKSAELFTDFALKNPGNKDAAVAGHPALRAPALRLQGARGHGEEADDFDPAGFVHRRGEADPHPEPLGGAGRARAAQLHRDGRRGLRPGEGRRGEPQRRHRREGPVRRLQ